MATRPPNPSLPYATPRRPAAMAPAPVVVLAAWLLPGAGYLLLRQRARGLTVGITVLLLFALGVLIGGLKVVDPPVGSSLDDIRQKPWFIGQALTGPVGLGTGYLSKTLLVTRYDATGRVIGKDPVPPSHARSSEIGTLYTAVAGMLNLLAIIDAGHRATYTDHEASEDDEDEAGEADGEGKSATAG